MCADGTLWPVALPVTAGTAHLARRPVGALGGDVDPASAAPVMGGPPGVTAFSVAAFIAAWRLSAITKCYATQ
jgi:hypothetical protein